MAGMISKLLLLSRGERGMLELNREYLNLSELTLMCVQELESAAREKKITIETEIEPEVYACVDETLYIHMLDNLLSNAATYGRQGGSQYKLDIQNQLEEAEALKEGLEEQKQRLEDLLAREEKDLDSEELQENLDEVNEELQSVTYHLQDLQTYMENNKDQLIGVSLKEAQELALELVEGAGKDDIVIALEYDDGGYKYEGDIIYSGHKYDFEIHAMTGEFLEWRKE